LPPSSLFRCVNGLTPVYLVRRFANGDPEFGAALFGVAEAALAAGAVGAGLTLPEYMKGYRKGQLLVAGFASYGALLVLLGLAPSLLPAMVIFFPDGSRERSLRRAEHHDLAGSDSA